MMENKQVNTLDALFREELGKARVQPSEQLWENIRRELDVPEKAVGAEVAEYAIPWKVWLAAASVGILLAVGLTLVLNRPQAPNQEFAGTDIEQVVPSVEVPIEQEVVSTPPANLPPMPNPVLAQHPIAPNATIPPVTTFDRPSREEVRSTQEKLIPLRSLQRPLPLVAHNLVQKQPGHLHPAHLPMRTGHDLDKPYAFFSADELNPDFNEFIAFEDPSQAEPGRWAVGGVFSPDFSLGRGGTPIASMFADGSGVTTFSTSTSAYSNVPSRAFSSGVNLAYAVNERIELQGGVTFSQRTSTGDGGYIRIQDDNTVATGVDTYANYDPSFSNTYLEVPMTMQYSLRPEKKLDVFLTSGVSTQLFIQNESSVESTDNRLSGFNSADVAPLSPYQLNVLIGAGAEYAFNDHISMNVEPLMRKALASNGEVYAGNPNLSMSLRTGLNYRF